MGQSQKMMKNYTQHAQKYKLNISKAEHRNKYRKRLKYSRLKYVKVMSVSEIEI